MSNDDIHKLSDREIVQSIMRMMGSPMERAMQAELDIRFTKAVTDLSVNVYSLKSSLDSLARSNKSIRFFLIIIGLCLLVLTGIVAYWVYFNCVNPAEIIS